MSFLAGKHKIVTALAVLLGFMLLCTLISKSVYASQLPQVTTETAKKRVLGRAIRVSGAVAQSREYAVSTLPAIRVKTVEVGKGDVVEEGAPLFSLDMQDLQEQIAAQELAVKKLEVQIATLQHNQSLADGEAVKNTDRLLEDYLDTASENDAAIERARIREAQADADFKKHVETPPQMTDEAGRREAWELYDAWVEREEKLQEEAARLTRELAAAQRDAEAAQAALEAAQDAGGHFFSAERPEAATEAGEEGGSAGTWSADGGYGAVGSAGETESAESPGTEPSDNQEPSEGTDTLEPAEAPGGTEGIASVEPSGGAELPEPAEPSNGTELPEPAEPPGGTGLPDSAEPPGGTGLPDPAEPSGGTDPPDHTAPDGEEKPDESAGSSEPSGGADTGPSGLDALEKCLREAEEKRDALAARLEEIQDKLQKHQADMVEKPDFSAEDMEWKNWETQEETLRRNAESADWAYEDALRQKADALKEAQRKVDDSVEPRTLEDTLALNRLELSWLNEVLTGYRKLQEAEGKITAPRKGVVTDIRVSAGNDTPDGAAVVYADQEENLEFRMTVSREDKKYINQGTVGRIQLGNRQEDCPVEYLEQQADGSFLAIVSLPEGMGNMGESGTFTVSWQSESYACCIPATALHEENQKKYIYVVRRQQGILGEELAAEKRFVTVLEEGDRYAALDASALQENEEVILTTTKAFRDGEIVRYRLTGTE